MGTQTRLSLPKEKEGTKVDYLSEAIVESMQGRHSWILVYILYGTKVPKSIWALNSNPAAWPMTPISFYPKPQFEPTKTAGPSFVTWSLLGKPFPNNKERIMSKHSILRMSGRAQGNTTTEHACWNGNQVSRPLSPHSPSFACPAAPRETLLLSMPAGMGTKFWGHFYHIPLPPNHPLTTDDIGPPIALTMAVIMISPLI